ncbi:MAG TPA: hypothetical protein VMR76_01990 [Candidatus Saccharimonadia bacterium]|nr:hypothetical protein [Candidatus Saccharimonadia bacterium]
MEYFNIDDLLENTDLNDEEEEDSDKETRRSKRKRLATSIIEFIIEDADYQNENNPLADLFGDYRQKEKENIKLLAETEDKISLASKIVQDKIDLLEEDIQQHPDDQEEIDINLDKIDKLEIIRDFLAEDDTDSIDPHIEKESDRDKNNTRPTTKTKKVSLGHHDNKVKKSDERMQRLNQKNIYPTESTNVSSQAIDFNKGPEDISATYPSLKPEVRTNSLTPRFKPEINHKIPESQESKIHKIELKDVEIKKIRASIDEIYAKQNHGKNSEVELTLTSRPEPIKAINETILSPIEYAKKIMIGPKSLNELFNEENIPERLRLKILEKISSGEIPRKVYERELRKFKKGAYPNLGNNYVINRGADTQKINTQNYTQTSIQPIGDTSIKNILIAFCLIALVAVVGLIVLLILIK